MSDGMACSMQGFRGGASNRVGASKVPLWAMAKIHVAELR